MKTPVLVALSILAFGCAKPEKDADRYRREAKEAMLKYSTNEVVGFQRLISSGFHDWMGKDPQSENPQDWKGEAIVEFVNLVGGRQRTNLTFHFRFETNEYRMPKVCVELDYAPWFEEEAKIKSKEFELWERSLTHAEP